MLDSNASPSPRPEASSSIWTDRRPFPDTGGIGTRRTKAFRLDWGPECPLWLRIEAAVAGDSVPARARRPTSVIAQCDTARTRNSRQPVAR